MKRRPLRMRTGGAAAWEGKNSVASSPPTGSRRVTRTSKALLCGGRAGFYLTSVVLPLSRRHRRRIVLRHYSRNSFIHMQLSPSLHSPDKFHRCGGDSLFHFTISFHELTFSVFFFLPRRRHTLNLARLVGCSTLKIHLLPFSSPSSTMELPAL